MANTPTEPAPSKKSFSYFRSPRHAGLTIQIQKMTLDKETNKKVQEVDEQATFTQYYDTWKGDTIRVGYLKTDSEKIAEACRKDDNVEEIDEKEYNQLVVGDEKHPALKLASTPAV